MNYFTIKKFAQIENLLQQKGYPTDLIDQVKLAPKALKRQIAQLVETQQPSKQQILDLLESEPVTEFMEKSPLDLVFENTRYNKKEFFDKIPEGYKKFVSRILISQEKRPEDIHSILDTINTYETMKKRTALPIERDINKYHNFAELARTIINFSEQDYKDNPRITVDPTKLEGVKLHEQQGQYKIWRITNADSLRQIGEGTLWCTRGSYKEPHLADEYLRDYHAIYTVTSGPNLVFQFTPTVDQFMDVHDIRAEKPNDLDLDSYVMNGLRNNMPVFDLASEKLKNDRETSLLALIAHPKNYPFINKEFTQDDNFLRQAVQNNGKVYQVLPKHLQQDTQIALQAVKLEPKQIEFAPENIKNNLDVALAAVKKNAEVITYLPDTLTDNEDIVLAAVEQHPRFLKYASTRFRKNADLVLSLIKPYKNIPITSQQMALSEKSYIAGYYADDSLKNDKDFIRKAIQINPKIFAYASKSIKADPEIALQVVVAEKDNPYYSFDDNSRHIAESLLDDEDFMLRGVKIDGKLLRRASPKIQNNREIALEAITQNAYALHYVSRQLSDDVAFLVDAVGRNSRSRQYLPVHMQTKVFNQLRQKHLSHGWYQILKFNSL